MNKKIMISVMVIIVTAIALSISAETSDCDIVLQMSRDEAVTGIPPAPPSNPPTPETSGTRFQYLWEDFEGTTFPPTDWDTLNLNPGWGWFLGTFQGGGTQAALVTWDQTPPPTQQDEWLITPELDVSAASSQLRVEFYMLQGYTYPHDFKVWVTDDDGDTWIEIFDSYGTGYPEFQWYFVSVPLTDWIGNADPIRIAFQYYGLDANLFGIDNVEVTDEDPPTGRCCVYTDPENPDCYDGYYETDCDPLGGVWVEGLNCIDNPCPLQGLQLQPSDDMYNDPGSGSGHPHPVEETSLWVADYSAPCGDNHQRIMLKWDLSAYDGQTVDSAFVHMYRYFRCPNSYYTNCDFYTITEDWTEETWNDYLNISHAASPFTGFNFGPALEWYRIDVSSVVNQWLDGSIENYGIVIRSRPGQKFSKFYSKEGLYPPYLELYGISGTANQCPILDTIPDQLSGTNSNLAFDISASDPDLTTPDLYCDNPPAGAVFTDNQDGTGTFEWMPADSQTGNHNILFYADDGEVADSQYVSILIYKCGDANADENVNVSDAVWIVNYVFIGGDQPDPLESGDANCDGSVNVSDAVWIVNYVFIGGNSPCDPNNDGVPDC
jgi:hypothetical protein